MKLDFQWPGALVFALVFLCLAALVFTGKIGPEALGALLAWLVPSPIQPKAPAPTEVDHGT